MYFGTERDNGNQVFECIINCRKTLKAFTFTVFANGLRVGDIGTVSFHLRQREYAENNVEYQLLDNFTELCTEIAEQYKSFSD